jgi:hypothetical protein
MNAVTTHGAPKITMDSQERDYQERLRQARAQGDGNPYAVGIQGKPQSEPTSQPTLEPQAPQFAAQHPREEESNQMGSDALDRRLEMYAKASGNADFSNNDRSQTMRG